MSLTILQGDALEKLRELPDESVQCCVTSPPYWGLRDYGTATWEGGDESCDHKPSDEWLSKNFSDTSALTGKESQRACGVNRWYRKDGSCKCGAKRIDAQIGLEETPDAYVAKIVEVFREVRRVLKKDGTLWMNLGDSYAAGGGFFANAPSNLNGSKQSTNRGSKHQARIAPDGLKPKDLCGIPWRVAFSLQADGWYLRSDIIWHKPNPMPESVTDRPTKAHEYLFLLSKSQRYYYDADAIREKTGDEISMDEFERIKSNGTWQSGGITQYAGSLKTATAPSITHPFGRNKRSVWTAPTAPYSEAHFATYPPDLIKPCILAGSRPGDRILDPFAGSGTTGLVAIELARNAILVELNPDYITLIERRCNVTMGLAL